MALADQFFTTSDGINLRYTRQGTERNPIVYLCGLGDNLSSWQSQVDAFSPTNHVIALDNRGAGLSDTPAEPFTISRMADDVHELVSDIGCGPVTAIGVSMGGAICQEWALRHPQDIDRMVVSSTWSAPDTYLDTLYAHWHSLAGSGNRRALIESLLLYCWSPGYLSNHPDVIQSFVEEESLNLTGFMSAADACRAHDCLSRVSSITQETLVLIGEHDILIRPELSHVLADQLPRVQVKTLSTGHMPYWEQPAEFATIVREFLEP